MPKDFRTSSDKTLTVARQPAGTWRFGWVGPTPKLTGSIELVIAQGGRWNFIATNSAGKPLRMYDPTGWATFDAALEAAAQWFATFRETTGMTEPPHADA